VLGLRREPYAPIELADATGLSKYRFDAMAKASAFVLNLRTTSENNRTPGANVRAWKKYLSTPPTYGDRRISVGRDRAPIEELRPHHASFGWTPPEQTAIAEETPHFPIIFGDDTTACFFSCVIYCPLGPGSFYSLAVSLVDLVFSLFG